MDNIYCIYKHTSPSGKSYIGFTGQTPENRWGMNGSQYKRVKGHHKFAAAIKKYGWDNFTHEILEEGLSFEEANQREIYYIALYDSFNNGYNATLGGGGTLGIKGEKSPWYNRKHTEEEKYLIGCGRRGRKLSDDRKKELSEMQSRKPVVCLSADGKFLAEYYNAQKAADELKIQSSQIRECCKHHRKIVHNYIFVYKDEYDCEKKYGYKRDSHNSKEIEKYDNQFNLIKTYNSISSCADDNEFNRSTLTKILNSDTENREHSVVNGYIYIYKGNNIYKSNIKTRIIQEVVAPKKVGKFTKQLELIEVYGTAAEAIRRTGFTSIRCCLNGTQKETNGFIFKYI